MRFVTPEEPKSVDPSKPAQTLLVIGAGLSRCATSSLHYVFEKTLGLGPSLHMAYIVPSVERLQLFLAALEETEDKEKRQALLHQLFDGYASVCDMPGCAFVDDLMEMYPSAKLLLNKRARAEDWIRSMKTIQMFSSKWCHVVCYWVPVSYLGYKIFKAFDARMTRNLGVDYFSNSPSQDVYEAHLKWVRGLAKAKGVALLEWMPEMGYAPLCEFLGKEIPKEPFPRLNDAKDMRIMKAYGIARGLLYWAGVLGLLAAPVVAPYVWSSLV